MSKNHLGEESSPYLLQHKDNPVHWYGWGKDALSEAKRLNRPVLLSIGYAACHWCHVMAHESFENPEIAELMNRLFINIKLDREERPDLDMIYQTSLQMLGEQGGWPLTMFLTPDAEPFWGGTYFPPEPRWGRPGFAQVLRRVAEIYHQQAEHIQTNVEALRAGLARLQQEQSVGPAPTPQILDRVAKRALHRIDPVYGGLQGAPKFPQVPLLCFLWNAFSRSRQSAYGEAVINSLTQMCQGGIYDHLGGGFARYSTDEVWRVPHFEKMLYDNAQLLELLTVVWSKTGDELYRSRVFETVSWLHEEMTIKVGKTVGFAGTLDADSDGVEGRFYVWRDDEIDALLKEDAALFKAHYDVTTAGNWEGATVLNRSRAPQLASPSVEKKLASCRKILRQARNKRPRPDRDHKILADWNAMAAAALARAGAVFERGDWIETAVAVLSCVVEQMTLDGRPCHLSTNDAPHQPATLDDIAQSARAALFLYEITGAPRFLALAESRVTLADDCYRLGASYVLSAADTTDVLVRPRADHDTATPAGNGVMAEVLVRLYLLTGKSDYEKAAKALIGVGIGDQSEPLDGRWTLLNAFDLLMRAAQIVVIGDDKHAAAFRREVFQSAYPHTVFQHLRPGESLPDSHPAAGKTDIHGGATAYLCVGARCGPPLGDPADLRAALDAL